MNLGDGLKLETQFLNGKPKLILAPCDVSSKETKRIKCKNRITHPLKSKQILQVNSSHENRPKAEKPLKPTVTNTIAAPGRGESTKLLITDKKTDNKTKRDGETALKNIQPRTKASVKKPSPTEQQISKKQKISSEELRENLVCLTQKQLQQILASVSQVNKTCNQKQQREKITKSGKGIKETEATDKDLKKEDNPTLLNGDGCSNNEASQDNSSCQEPQANKTPGSKDEQANILQSENMGNKQTLSRATNQTKDGLFGNLGERENAKDQLEAKRIQWKKELDEQVALKKQLQKSNEASEFLEWNPWRRQGARIPMQSNTQKIVGTFKGKASLPTASGAHTDSREINTAPTLTVASNTDGTIGKASSFSFPDLPAAIRSTFVLGEFSPQDNLFGAIKREQQKKWLQELDKQREEEKSRKLKEKLKYSEGDHHSRWAMHFDSYQRKPDQKTTTFVNVLGSTLEKSPAPGDGQPSVLKVQQFSTQASPLPDQRNSAGEDGRIMVDDTGFNLSSTQKSSFLRSMTALLDPAEIEERDIRRKKQLEHQKAIAIQVEERRRQRQLEEDQKQKEELRLAKERERLRQQYEEETRTQMEKEELHNFKTNLLYETVQKAQEEAKRQKHEQRINDLVSKGHDISNLQKNVEGAVCEVSSCVAPSNLACDTFGEELEQHSITEESSRKDREGFELNEKDECGMHNAQIIDLGQLSAPSDAATKCNGSNNKHTKRKSKPMERMPVTGKENCLQSDDLSEQCARMKKGKNEKRPEWNTNKTNKKYIPASQRYPKGLQMEREEKKMKRQMELLQQLEKNTPNQRSKKNQTSKELSSERRSSPVVPAQQVKIANSKLTQPVEKRGLSHIKKEDLNKRSNSNNKLPVDKDYSCGSSPVPALRNKHLQMEREFNSGECCQWAPLAQESENDRLSSFNFVPYVRTDEVYHLDPDAPMSRPSTDDPQYKRCSVMDHLQHCFNHPKDPLLNPDLLRNRERQQAILKGLSELRQGLMQKQRELEAASQIHQDYQSLEPL
ncbi:coiled-coil domain-containing protein 66 isoform X2 [Narcine bancroftii]|uniref:coiled-coil domain-containing protein 66 isoform X2 n=1 Tax=Narcine bancroftii TaxID=1343680 RepID=UPI003831A64A